MGKLTVLLDNRLGALLSIVELLKKNHIEVLGLSVRDAIDATVARLIVSDPDAVETTVPPWAFRETGDVEIVAPSEKLGDPFTRPLILPSASCDHS